MFTRKLLAILNFLSVFVVSVFSPSLVLADDSCMWTDFYGECVAYDEWATNAFDESSVCIWNRGDSDLVCEYPNGNDGWVTEDEWDIYDEDYDDQAHGGDDWDDDGNDDCDLDFNEWNEDNADSIEEWDEDCNDEWDERYGEDGEWDEDEWENDSDWGEEDDDEEWIDYEEHQEDSGRDEDYLEHELDNLADNLEWIERAGTDLEREYKRGERLLKEYDRKLKDLDREREWFEEEDRDMGPIEEFEQHVAEDSQGVEDVLGRFDAVLSDLSAVLVEAQDAYDGVTEETVNAVWLIINKAQLVTSEVDVLRAEINHYDTTRGFWDWNFQAALIENDYADLGMEMSDELNDGLDEAAAIQAEYLTAYDDYWTYVDALNAIIDDIPDYSMSDLVDDEDYRTEIWDLYNGFWDARQDMGWADQDLHYITDDLWDMWEIFDQAWEEISFGNDLQWVLEDIVSLREDVSIVSEAFEMLQDKVEEPSVLADIDEVLRIVDQALTMLEEMEEMAADIEDPEDMEDMWHDMEALGQYVDPRMQNVMDYLDREKDSLNLSPDEEALIMDMMSAMEEDDRGGERFEEAYGRGVYESFESYMGEGDINDLIALVTSTVMQSLSEYIDSDLADEIVAKLMASLEHFKAEKFGADFTNQLLENGNRVYEQMAAVDFDSMDEVNAGLQNDLEDLYEDFQALPMPEEDLAEESASFWEEVATTVSADPSEDEVRELLEDGEELLMEVEEAQYENQLALKDVPGYFDEDFEDVWYADAVMEGLGENWDGYKDANGNPTYKFGPSDITLRAEALKIVLSTFGYPGSGTGGQWFIEWQNRAKELGLSIAEEDQTQAISRKEVFRLIFEVAHMDSDGFHGYFSDVGSGEDYGPVEALYEAGIVMGDDGSGDARLNGSLNRAEMAALIQRVAEWNGEQEFLEEDLFSYQNSDGFSLGRFLAALSRFFRDIMPANLLD